MVPPQDQEPVSGGWAALPRAKPKKVWPPKGARRRYPKPTG